MFISVRGTSGSGKTHLAKRVLHAPGLFHPPVPVFYAGRGIPVYYTREPVDSYKRGLAILGSYENNSGGCDTLSGNDVPFMLYKHLGDRYMVFAEGLLLSAEQRRTKMLHEEGHLVELFYLTTPVQECFDSVSQRRAARGKEPLVMHPMMDLVKRHSALRGHPARFRGLGVAAREGDRDAAVAWAQDLRILPQGAE